MHSTSTHTKHVFVDHITLTGYATESQAIPEWPHRKAGDCEAKMGDGV